MPVLLRQSSDVPDVSTYDAWIAVGETPETGPDNMRISGIGPQLEDAFKAIGPAWWALGKVLGTESSAAIAHMPSCGAYGSDFGLMLAWSRLIEAIAKEGKRTLVLCNDPWAFRHFATLDGVTAGRAPGLRRALVKKALRGMLARIKVSLSVARAAWTTRAIAQNAKADSASLLVYGHPASRADGYDDYFGTLMADEPALGRMLHTDCPPARANELAQDGRTASLHAFGSLFFALALPFVGWRPHQQDPLSRKRPEWLIRRAAAIENSGGGPAMNAWQHHCQARWMKTKAPTVVLWPWENHGWERAFCRAAQAQGVATVGYQHTTIGPYQFNYSPRGNVDPEAELPDAVIANGPATQQEMADWGVPRDRLIIGGTFRLPKFEATLYDPDGPVFVPLSANPHATQAQLQAAVLLAEGGQPVVVKEHPMYPASIKETETLRRTSKGLNELGGVRALVYATGTMGLQGLLAGVPTIRLRMDNSFGMDVLPKRATPIDATLDGLVATVRTATPATLAWSDILAPVDGRLWHQLVQSVKTPQDLAAIIGRHKHEENPSP